ncbi:MAG: CPBP family intramembrane metalloprotease [Dysgonamonadaceae bacterium]|jgi:membrane protease YdiL (CAAX protease family)|nr:CPBP family intramembrane metalloprotease [Dysgonamonadaceae bacterium]
MLKAALKNSSVFVQVLLLVALIFFGYMAVSMILVIIFLLQTGLDSGAIEALQSDLLNRPGLIKTMQTLQVFGMFIFPALACAWLYSDNVKSYLSLRMNVSWKLLALTALSVLAVIPFLNCTYAINQQMVFPEWLSGVENWIKTMEETSNRIFETMLYVHHWWDIPVNILLVCVLAAISEELIFRGLLQNLLSRAVRNPHAAIWITAIIFSAFHLQFYGFIPRMLIGAYLGYLLYYTGSIWVSVLAHFTNNLFSTVVFSVFQDSPEMAKSVDALGYGQTWWLAVVSLFWFGYIAYCIFKSQRKPV